MVSVKEFLANKTVVGLLLGQILSLLITSTGFSSSELARRGINAPTSQSLANYVMLAVVYGGILIHRGRGLKAKWYYYLLLGLVDVEANYLVVKAYQYTSITSIMLLDCWSIPSVILLTWLFLKTKYRFKKIAGVAICVAGLVLVIFSDVHAADRSQNGSSPIKGDFLVVAGATLYAVSNVSEEFFVTTADRIELMAMLGFFGAILLPYTGFAAAMFLFYSGVPVLLKMSGSTMLNLSLLTSDMWSVLIRIFAYHEKVDWMYFVAFAAVAVGLVVYSGFDKETRSEVADGTEQSKYLDEEAGVTSSSKPNVASSSSNKHEFASTSKTNTESSIYKGKDSPIKKI
ncbi:Protein of unknown function DUF914, eukaryotic [Cynara cardunculus var. scolymus]|uniref:Solute carrier family 35 member SLC35F1/F2/F6 n=1 Tax=Cynara cardunculus var. scolymus TaxID=59895 RepID=A0A103Y0N5_CYNCS|nr:Protein of unknown function DUF914, eukaryotic [Cynara cardunculus var. scolymus]